jgi:hypothetical protein
MNIEFIYGQTAAENEAFLFMSMLGGAPFTRQRA